MRVVGYIVGTVLIVTGLVGLGVIFFGPSSLTDPAAIAEPTEPPPATATAVPVRATAPAATGATSTALPTATALPVAAPRQPTSTALPAATMAVSVLERPTPGAAPTVVPVAAMPTLAPATPVATGAPAAAVATVAPAAPALPPSLDGVRPITWLAIPRIHLETTVVPAALVQDGDSVTWDIPKFVAGHAETTAGAGEAGNAVVLGHLVSRTLGNVFEHLDNARTGDLLRVRSGAQEFDYTVVDVRNVDRTDVEVLDRTSTPTITLITCAGLWNPVLHDYMERLVVRGQLEVASQ